MNSTDLISDVIVVGAGISGLSARRSLLDAGLSVQTLEKSRGLSGRASTRRTEGISADMGAQFVSAKGEAWKRILHRNDALGLHAIHLADAPHFPRYIHSEGISRLGRLLVEEPSVERGPILFSAKVSTLEQAEGAQTWEVRTEEGKKFWSRALVLSAPLPQSLALLETIKGAIEPGQLERLRGVKYSRCLAVAFTLKQDSKIPAPGILRNPSATLLGIYDQAKKGIATSPVVVVHGAPQLSEDLWDESEERILQEIWGEARAAAPKDSLPERDSRAWLQKWRYCEPTRTLEVPFEKIEFDALSLPLLLVGDAFGGSRVEGAFESGRLAGLDLCKGKWTTKR